MKHTPLAVLALILAFSLWNSAAQTHDAARWQAQLDRADALAQAEDWSGTVSALEESYADWSRQQTYLHIVSHHGSLDEAESLYRRCLAFAEAEEPAELRAELADLRHQLGLLAEMERFSVGNIM